MFPTFRQSMAWLHGWVGLVLGGLLFAVFFAGSVAVFDRELDRWMQPSTRLAPPAAEVSLDALRPAIAKLVGRSPQWGVLLPSAREPMVQLRFRGPHGSAPVLALDPADGRVLAKSKSLGASGFFLPFHYSLLITWMQLGYWIVGFAAAALLLALVSGVAIHAKLAANLFTYRPDAPPRRRLLDLHNLTGVSSLPFIAAMALSGLLVSYSNLMPAGIDTVYGGARAKYSFEVFENFRRPLAKKPAILAPLDPMMAEAARRWGGDRPMLVQVYNAGDAAAYVEMRRRNAGRITSDPGLIYFDGVTGHVLKATPLRPAMTVQRWLTGLHMAAFAGVGLRWLYLLLGLSGCAAIAAGLLVWLERRRARSHAVGHRLVEAVVVACVAGPVMATLAYLIANRVAAEAAQHKAAQELSVYFAVWALSLAHAVVRVVLTRDARAAWREQCGTAAILALAAPVADVLTTGSGLLRAFDPAQGAAAAVDLVLLAAGAAAAVFTLSLRRPLAGPS